MPILSVFYGIIVRMYREKDQRHHKPHVHAEYSGDEVVVTLEGEVLEMLQPRIMKVEPLPDYRLKLDYETGEVKYFDVGPYIDGAWFGRLKDARYFKTVHLAMDGSGIEWADGQDIAPHELYDLSVQ